jgi:hypothetical protein
MIRLSLAEGLRLLADSSLALCRLRGDLLAIATDPARRIGCLWSSHTAQSRKVTRQSNPYVAR